MAKYYTQDATVGKDVYRFYGDQAAHAHDTGVEFSKAITDLMQLSFPNAKKIELGHFASNQSSIPSGGKSVIELKWKKGAWTNK